ncbi:hypothetical protein Bpfe_030837 [Biomphalaria pfeifferi]|uniref:Uncharacterized protein n=1 Tax=Biomphalaria pfeifferi TaxID=112525 RepID=A0AAD8EUD5_BIOPF|nr:hypothetical protein Bpfe_030837 [Biomphalaria pfeifferi]
MFFRPFPGLPSLFNLIYLNNALLFYTFTQPYDDQGNMFYFDMANYLQNMDITFFAASLHLLCYKELYDINVSKWNLTIEIQSFAKSTKNLSFKCNFLSNDQKLLLASVIVSIFPVQKAQKKRAPIDEELGRFCPENTTYSSHQVLDVPKPQDAYCVSSRVGYHETDSHHHMAAMSYYNHVIDAIYSAVVKGCVFEHLTRERFQQGVSSFEMVYLKECLMDDLLDVFVWEIPNHDMRYRRKLKDVFVSPFSRDQIDDQLHIETVDPETDGYVIMCVVEVRGKPCLRAIVQFFN